MTFDVSTGRNTTAASAMPTHEPVFVQLDSADAAQSEGPPEATNEQRGADASAPPDWFARKRAQQAEGRQSSQESQPGPPPAPPPPPTQSPRKLRLSPHDNRALWDEPGFLEKLKFLVLRRYDQRVKQEGERDPRFRRFEKCVQFALSGSGISLLCHALVLSLLGIAVFTAPDEKEALSLLASEADTTVPELEEIDTKLDLAGAPEEEFEPPQLKAVETAQLESRVPDLSNDLAPKLPGIGGGSGNSSGEGQGQQFAVPETGKVVKKGSFTAWTVPEDPDPGENYLIVIQVELPEKVKRYRSTDLSGRVVGTDNYRQPIPGFRREWLPVKDHRAQLIVQVPGAGRLVRDTISIRSKLLGEKQTLEIEF